MCFKERKSLQSNACVGSGSKRRRPIVHDGCGAKLAVVKSKYGKYVVSIRGGNMGQDSFIRFDSIRIKWVWIWKKLIRLING